MSRRTRHWLVPTAEAEQIQRLIVKGNIWAYGINTPGRHMIKPGDRACFYLKRQGVVAHATAKTQPRNMKHPQVKDQVLYPWVFELEEISVYIDNPVKITKPIRKKLDYFQKPNLIDTRTAIKNWGVFVMNNKEITKHDFDLITRK
ncbi:MAG: EVE domain-containing protein [Candidatus Bathyarchaeota archaeon]|nr:EVE domain-containing protein [Candidatus Bathyarchaeota archaeon]